VNLPRKLSLTGLVFGAFLLVFVAACGGGGDDKPSPTPAPASPTATSTPTGTPTEVPTPTATPTPYDGDVARFIVPKLGVDAPVENLGVDASNTMETPVRENTDVGWYHIWDRPGWDGNAVFSAHVYWENVPAPFQRLSTLVEGDEVDIEMNNGEVYKYQVISKNRYSRDNIPMGDIIWPKERPADEQWITMITCGGELDSTGWEYLSRDVVVAKRIS
jgi:sortase (surface protein transpeptidase)